MIDDVEVFIRRPDRTTVGMTSTWESLTLVQRRNDVGQWTLVTKSAEDALELSPTLNAAGKITSRPGVIIRVAGETVASGWLSKQPEADHSGGQATWTFTGRDDTFLLQQAQCWPKPDAPVNAQTDAYDVRQGPASNRIRDYYIANVALRMGVAGATGGNQLNLGPNRKSKARFRGLLELAQAIAKRDLNFAVRQRDSDRALFLYQWLPVDRRADVVFSPPTGTVQSWSTSSTETTANVVIVGAGGEGEARGFVREEDPEDVAAWGPIEQFKDRRDLSLTEDGQPTDWQLEAEEDALTFLEENVGRTTFKVDIRTAGTARPFVHYWPGDLVRAYVATDDDGQPIGLVDDLVEEISVTYSSAGEQGEVRIGAMSEDTVTKQMARQIRLMDRRIKYLEADR